MSGRRLQVLQPPGWMRPKGYANGIVASGRLVFIGGQIGWNEQQRFDEKSLVGQARQALANVLAILAEVEGKPEHIARMTWYVVDRNEYLSNLTALGVVYRELMGLHFPVMTAVEVSALIEDAARVEIEATAVVPEDS